MQASKALGDSGWRLPRPLKAVLAIGLALLAPSPYGIWSPMSLILWALVGDPASTGDALASLSVGACLLVAYAAAAYGVVSLCEHIAQRIHHRRRR